MLNIKAMGIAVAITALVAGAAGFEGGKRWVKAGQAKALEAAIEAAKEEHEQQLEAERENAAQELNLLQASWEREVSKKQAEVDAWRAQSEEDQRRIAALSQRHVRARREIDELATQLAMLDDIGTCNFAPAAVRLLNDASRSTNRLAGPRAGGGVPPAGEGEAGGGDGSLRAVPDAPE